MTGNEDQTYAHLSMDRPALYRIRVHGTLGEKWSGRMGSMQIHWQTQADGSIMTILKGRLIDQAALFGVLTFLYNLRLPLISVECLESDQEDSPLMKVRVKQRTEFMEFIVSGAQSALPIPDPLEMVLNSCKLAGLYRVLVDFRGLVGGDREDPEIGYAKGVGQEYQGYLAAGGTPIEVAVVGKEEMIEAWKQSEEIVRSYGLNVFITGNYEEASAWLRNKKKDQ